MALSSIPHFFSTFDLPSLRIEIFILHPFPMSQEAVEIYQRDGLDLQEVNGIGLHLPIRFHTKYFTLLCLDCGRFMANCANSWVHLRTKHPNLHLNLTKKDYLALVEAKVGPTKLANPQLDTSNALSLLSDPKAQHLPIQGLAFDNGYVCNLCVEEGNQCLCLQDAPNHVATRSFFAWDDKSCETEPPSLSFLFVPKR